MSDARDRLVATLTELQRELAEAGPVDKQLAPLLQNALSQIESALDATAPQPPGPSTPRSTPPVDSASNAPAPSAEQPWRRPLLDAAQHFEATHPTLAGLISSLVDALAQLGL